MVSCCLFALLLICSLSFVAPSSLRTSSTCPFTAVDQSNWSQFAMVNLFNCLPHLCPFFSHFLTCLLVFLAVILILTTWWHCLTHYLTNSILLLLLLSTFYSPFYALCMPVHSLDSSFFPSHVYTIFIFYTLLCCVFICLHLYMHPSLTLFCTSITLFRIVSFISSLSVLFFFPLPLFISNT